MLLSCFLDETLVKICKADENLLRAHCWAFSSPLSQDVVLNAHKSSSLFLSSSNYSEYVQLSPHLWQLSDRIILQGLVLHLILDHLVALDLFPLGRLRYQAHNYCRHPYSSISMVNGWSWYWRPRESGLCCVQLAVLLTTHHCSYQWLLLIAIEETPSHATTTGFQWFSLIAIEVTSSHTTTTGIEIGVDLEVISKWLSLIAIEENLLLRHYHWCKIVNLIR